jgi:NAD(P)-dependent dehydrogenase (short-subunit alcohol dehydrogenase family)
LEPRRTYLLVILGDGPEQLLLRFTAGIGESSNTTGVRGEAASTSDPDNLYAQIRRKTGRLDVIFANAGGGRFAPRVTFIRYFCLYEIFGVEDTASMLRSITLPGIQMNPVRKLVSVRHCL